MDKKEIVLFLYFKEWVKVNKWEFIYKNRG